MFAHLNPHSSDFGDICALYPPCWHQLTMYLVRVTYGLVQATVGVGTVLIWDHSVVITRGGGILATHAIPLSKPPFQQGTYSIGTQINTGPSVM